jgi:hypothetical protein
VEGSGLILIWGIIPAFGLRDRGKPRKNLSGYPVFGSRFEPGTSRVRITQLQRSIKLVLYVFGTPHRDTNIERRTGILINVLRNECVKGCFNSFTYTKTRLIKSEMIFVFRVSILERLQLSDGQVDKMSAYPKSHRVGKEG